MKFIFVTDPFALKFCSLLQNNIGLNIRDGMIFVTCEQTLSISLADVKFTAVHIEELISIGDEQFNCLDNKNMNFFTRECSLFVNTSGTV